MRKKEKKCIISFATTTNAMECEAKCRGNGMAGRLIPLPKEISAGCGLAWCTALEEKKALLLFMETEGIIYESCHEILF